MSHPTDRQPMAMVFLLFLAGLAQAAENPVLVAPLYKGSVPAVLAPGEIPDSRAVASFGGVQALDCGGGDVRVVGAITWCFLSRDPIDKVRAFYEKAAGPMHGIVGRSSIVGDRPVQGYAAYVEQAWHDGSGEMDPSGMEFRAVSLHALPPPGSPDDDEEADSDLDEYSDARWEGDTKYRFYAGSRHFGGFVEAVDWFGDPSKRSPASLDAAWQKHKRLESALYQRQSADARPFDEVLRERHAAIQAERVAAAQAAAYGTVPTPEQMMQMVAQAQSADQQSTQEDAEFEAFMQRNPTVAKRYTELTVLTMQLAQQGRWDEADEVDEELEALVQANPELAAIERRADERAAASAFPSGPGAGGAAGSIGDAWWDPWAEYIEAATREAYYTLIVVDAAFTGSEPQYSRDRSIFQAATAGTAPHQGVLGFSYDHVPEAATLSTPAEGEKPGLKDKASKGLRFLRERL